MKTIVAITLIIAISLPCMSEEKLPVGVCFIGEMGFVPELDSWQPTEPDKFAAQTRQAQQKWQQQSKNLQKYLSPALARELSRYAEKEMGKYQKVSSLSQVKLVPVSTFRKGAYITFSGTIDTLPTHSPLVTRWLTVYVLYNSTTDKIERTTFTIRGELLE